jgi:hypothetical protein
MFNCKSLSILFLAAVACVLSGCTTAVTYRANPRFQDQAPSIHTVVLLPSEIKVYQIDAGGVREEIAEWSTQAQNNLIAALDNELRRKTQYSLRIETQESLAEEKARLEETRALYAAVSAMILLHTYPNPNIPSYLFQEKLKSFDYSLGNEVSDLADGADALLFLDAQDHVWTAGRQALQALGVILGIGAGVATGVVVIPIMGGGTGASAALVDSHTGDILWINAVGSRAGKDLRDPGSAREMVSELFKDFPMSYGRQSKEEKAH